VRDIPLGSGREAEQRKESATNRWGGRAAEVGGVDLQAEASIGSRGWR